MVTRPERADGAAAKLVPDSADRVHAAGSRFHGAWSNGVRALVVCLLLLSSGMPAQELALETVKLPDGEFQFNVHPAEAIAALPFPPDGENVQGARTQSYLVYADMDGVHLSKYNYFHYAIYLRPRGAAASGIVKYFVQGLPVGSFADRLADVQFTIKAQGIEEPGVIRLPIFSLTSRSYVECSPFTKPVEVTFAGQRFIPLAIKNTIGLPVIIKDTSEVVQHNTDLWQKIQLVGGNRQVLHEVEIAPGATSTSELGLLVVPRPAQAFANSFLPLARQPVHEQISINLDYTTRGGAPHSIDIDMPIRFKPWPPTLLVAVVIGAVVGSLIPVLGTHSFAGWPRAALIAILMGILAELVGMVLVANDSQFRLLGLDLDPYQVMPAFLIGGLVGLFGFKSAEAFQGLFKKA